MHYDLRDADIRLKWLVTCLLATFGVAYTFGAWMVALYSGFGPTSVAATFAEAEMPMRMPPESTMVLERAMTLSDFSEEAPHKVDRDLLIQDTHVHVPMYGVMATALACIVLGLALPRWVALALITLVFAAPWLDFAGMWLTKLVSPRFALLTVAGGWSMGAGYALIAILAMWQMWKPQKGLIS